MKGAVVSYKRSHTNQYVNQNILKIQGVNDRKSTEFYFGKKVAYVYMRLGFRVKSWGGKSASARPQALFPILIESQIAPITSSHPIVLGSHLGGRTEGAF